MKNITSYWILFATFHSIRIGDAFLFWDFHIKSGGSSVGVRHACSLYLNQVIPKSNKNAQRVESVCRKNMWKRKKKNWPPVEPIIQLSAWKIEFVRTLWLYLNPKTSVTTILQPHEGNLLWHKICLNIYALHYCWIYAYLFIYKIDGAKNARGNVQLFDP